MGTIKDSVAAPARYLTGGHGRELPGHGGAFVPRPADLPRPDLPGRDRRSLAASILLSGDDEIDLGWATLNLDRKVPGFRAEHEHRRFVQVTLPFDPTRWVQTWHDGGGRTHHGAASGLDYFVAPAGVPHACDWREPTDLLTLNFEAEQLRVLGAEILPGAAQELVPFYGPQSPAVQDLARLIRRECWRGASGARLSLEGLVIAFAIEVMRGHGRGGPLAAADRPAIGLSAAAFRRVLAFIEAELGRELHIAELAAIAGVSAGHFQRGFKQATGASPAHFLMQRRIARAKALLDGPRRPLIEIALACGFADQAHFATAFKREVGAPPSTYRRLVQG